MRYAILTSDTHSDYSFVAPISALMWREVIGFEPVVYLVGRENDWQLHPQRRQALDRLRAWQIRHHYIEPVEGYRTSTVAQVSRIFAAADPFDSNDVLITTDVDMWPVSKPWFNQTQDEKLTLFFSNYGGQRFPMCYLAAKASMWREILGIEVSSISQAIAAHLREHLASTADEGTAWHHDEIYLGKKIHAWHGYPSQCKGIERHGDPPYDRIDRAAWPHLLDLNGRVDAHLLRPPLSKWAGLRPLASKLLSASSIRAVEDYVRAYEAAK